MNTYEITTLYGSRCLVSAEDTDGAVAALNGAEAVSIKLEGKELMEPCQERVDQIKLSIEELQRERIHTAGHTRRKRIEEKMANLSFVQVAIEGALL